jgi:hypothetical protein
MKKRRVRRKGQNEIGNRKRCLRKVAAPEAERREIVILHTLLNTLSGDIGRQLRKNGIKLV